MSGLLVSLRPATTGAAEQIVEDLSFVEGSWPATVQEEGFTLVQARSDREDLWRPAVDPETGTTVALAGRIALSEAEWQQAKALPYSGGLACRHVLRAFLRDRAASRRR